MWKKSLLVCAILCAFCSMRANNPAYDSALDSLRMEAPVFSHNHGYYDEAFSVSISARPQGAIVRYTTDGSEPTADNGKTYSSPIRVEKTTVLRACVLSNGEQEYNSRITTRSYLFIDDIMQQGNHLEGYPDKWGPYAQRSGTAKADYEMDPELTATAAQRDSIRKGFLSLPVVSVVTDKGYIFNHENDAETGGIYIYTDPPTGYTKVQVNDPGTKWLRPTSVEFFDAASGLSIQADCGLRLHGGHSRLPEKSPKHSFRLVFKEKYGKKKLKANIFGETQAKKLDNIVLRAGFCNTWIHANNAERDLAVYTRDPWAKEVQAAMGHPHSHQRFAHLFLNGIYWGMYNITERIDEGWCEEYLGGYDTDYDVIKVEDDPQRVEASNGSRYNWEQLFDYSFKSASQANYDEIDRLLDIENFIDYMIINLYGANTDWDRHNWLAVYNTIEPNEGFKMLCWDSEHVLKELHKDVGIGQLRELCPSVLMQNLMKYPQFCRLVGDRIQKQCFHNGPLEPENTTEIWLRLSEIISSALHCEAARWGDYRKDVHQWNYAPFELYTKESHYIPAQKKMLEEILPHRRDVFVELMKDRGLYPTVTAPEIYRNGSLLNNDACWEYDIITLDHTEGDIYYSLNGEDPAEWDADGNGSVSSSAKKYMQQEFTLDKEAFCLKARVLKNGQWSALSELNLALEDIKTDIPATTIESRCSLANTLVKEGKLRLQYQAAAGNSLRVYVYSLSGQLCQQALYKSEQGQNYFDIDLSQLAEGVYFMHCQDGQMQQSFKIIKQ